MSSGSSGGALAHAKAIGHDVEELVVDAIGALELEYETDAHHDAVVIEPVSCGVEVVGGVPVVFVGLIALRNPVHSSDDEPDNPDTCGTRLRHISQANGYLLDREWNESYDDQDVVDLETAYRSYVTRMEAFGGRLQESRCFRE